MSDRVLCVVGTRPEAIKMAPVILMLQQAATAEVRVLATAQHRGLLDQALSLFGILPDIDLDIMQPEQSLAELTSRLVSALDRVLEKEAPDIVLAQGDTTTVMVTALAAFYRGIPFGHVEAGLRTGHFDSPFPEEMNRVLTASMATWHFAPTELAASRLRNEAIPQDRIHVTGNTGIDALLMTAKQEVPLGVELDASKKLVLVTAHRRENFGAPFLDICRALRTVVQTHDDIEILYPVHPNPKVRQVAEKELGDCPGILLSEPLRYDQFVNAMKDSFLILSDSGGVQEEAPALAKPVLVLRNDTERQEAIDAGVSKLVGTNHDRIVSAVNALLEDADEYAAMARGASPYGDGNAASRIVDALLR